MMGRESVREARATGRTGPPRRRLIARSQIYAWPLYSESSSQANQKLLSFTK